MASFAAVMSYAALEGDEQQQQWAHETVEKVATAFADHWRALIDEGVPAFEALKATTDAFDQQGQDKLKADDMGKAIQGLFIAQLSEIDGPMASLLQHQVEKERWDIPADQPRL